MAELVMSRLAGAAGAADVLVVGPSLGTSVHTLWSSCAQLLGDRFEVLGWDLPGRGRSKPAAQPFAINELAAAVRDQADRAAGPRPVWYAGVSLGGLVGFSLALDPGPVRAVAALASAPRIGDAKLWADRAALVRSAGTPALVPGAPARWFGPGFAERAADVAAGLLAALAETDRASYAWACDALAAADLRSQVADAKVPMLVAAGEHDQVVAPDTARAAATSVPAAQFRLLRGCAHLPPAEDPAAVAAMITDFVGAHRGIR